MSGQELLPPTAIDLPLLPLRDVVVFPHMVIPLYVGRAKSIKALETAMAADRRIMLVAQKTAAKDEPSAEDMFDIGCVASILQMLKLPDGTVKVLVEGVQRAAVLKIVDGEEHFTAHVEPTAVEAERVVDDSTEIEALRRALGDHVAQRGSLNAPDRLRFDFSHAKALSAEELAQIEAAVVQEIPLSVRTVPWKPGS